MPRTITAELDGPPPPPGEALPPSRDGNGGAPPLPPSGGGDEPPSCDDDARKRARSELEEYLPDLEQLATWLCATQVDAEDLVQNLAVHVCKIGIAANIRNPKAWLTTMLHHRFIDQCRATKRRPHHDQLDNHAESLHDNVEYFPMEDPEPAWANVTVEHIWTALDDITEPFRQVFILHEFEGWSYGEIAAHLQISSATVGSRLTRVRKRLQTILTKLVGQRDADDGDGEDDDD